MLCSFVKLCDILAWTHGFDVLKFYNFLVVKVIKLLRSGMLEWLPFHVISKYRQYVLSFRHTACVWQTDGQNYDPHHRVSIKLNRVKEKSEYSLIGIKINLMLTYSDHLLLTTGLWDYLYSSISCMNDWPMYDFITQLQLHRMSSGNRSDQIYKLSCITLALRHY